MWFLNSRQTFISFTPKVELPTTTRNIFTVRKRSCRKVMFSQACVKNGGVYQTPPQQTRQTLPQADNPMGRHPPGQTPPGHMPPSPRQVPLGYCSGRYASYWNAFLFYQFPRTMYRVISRHDKDMFKASDGDTYLF